MTGDVAQRSNLSVTNVVRRFDSGRDNDIVTSFMDSFPARFRRMLCRERWKQRIREFAGGTAPRLRARWHEFRCGPRLAPTTIAAFEDRWRIRLPEDYCALLSEVGNGCGGPFYGLSRLEEWHQPDEEPAPGSEQLRKPFDPHATTRPIAGAIRICNVGCERYVLLVITGPHVGELWIDATIDGLGLRPIGGAEAAPMLLRPWLEGWMGRVVRASLEMDDEAPTPNFGHAVAQVIANAREPLTTIAAEQLPCPGCLYLIRTYPQRLRLIVPVARSDRMGNPKIAAVEAASGLLKMTPRQVFP